MKRIMSILSVCASVLCCASSAFAWDAESFLGDSDLFYSYRAVQPLTLDAPSAAADMDPSAFDWSNMVIVSPSYYSRDDHVRGTVAGTSYNYTVTEYKDLVFNGFSMGATGYWGYSFKTASWSTDTDDQTFSHTYSNYGFYAVMDCPIALSGGYSSVEFTFDFSRLGAFPVLDGNTTRFFANYCELYVDDVLVKTYQGSNLKADYIYNSTSIISSVKVRLIFDVPIPDITGGDHTIYASIQGGPAVYLRVSGVGANAVLDGYNDDAQQSIDEHEAIESQWTGSMVDNFNNLHMEDFAFPSGLVSGFALITGIFNNLWNVMGEYKILYVFPLTLALALLVTGRIAKSAGREASSARMREPARAERASHGKGD